MESSDSLLKSTWLNEYYSDALQSATEFTDSFLDQAFGEMEQRLSSIKARSKPQLSQAVTTGQRINLEHLLPELEFVDGEHEYDEALIAQYEAPGLPEVEWLGEVDHLDYPDLYDDIERAELDYAAPEVAKLLKTLNSRTLECTGRSFLGEEDAAETPARAQAGTFQFADTDPVSDDKQEAAPASGQPASQDAEPVHEAELVEAVEFPARHQGFPAQSAVPADQSLTTIQTPNNALLQLDAQQIAQALVDMYVENERVLNERREQQLAEQARQRRQMSLIAGGAVSAVLLICLIAFLVINLIRQEQVQAASGQSIPTAMAGSEMPAPVYESVNQGLYPAGTEADAVLRGEVRTAGAPEQSHLADQVGAEEFDYFSEERYAPDSYADAETDYYPMAESDSAVVVETSQAQESLLEKAHRILSAGDTDAARTAYKKILAADANDVEALVGLGSMSQSDGNAEAATAYFVRAIKQQPDHAFALAALASMASNVNQAQQEADLIALAKNNIDVAELPFILGNWYARDKRWAEAQQAYFDAFNRDSNNADYAFNLAIALDQLGKPGMAESYYRKAVALAPGSAIHFNVEQARARADVLQDRG